MPELGEHTCFDEFEVSSGGNGQNVAINLCKLGVPLEYFSCALGDDTNGKFLIEVMEKEGVPTSDIQIVRDCKTGVSIVNIASNLDKRIFQYVGANGKFNLPFTDKEKIKKLDYLILTGFAIMDCLLSELDDLFVLCKRNNVKIIAGLTSINDASLKCKITNILYGIDYLFLNELELRLFGQKYLSLPENIDYLHRKGVTNILVTLGQKGVVISTKNGTRKYLDAFPASVRDTTGAGDAFLSGFVYGLSKGQTLNRCAEYGLYVASRCIECVSSSRGLNEIKEKLTDIDLYK